MPAFPLALFRPRAARPGPARPRVIRARLRLSGVLAILGLGGLGLPATAAPATAGAVDAARLLDQATFGPTPESLATVRATGPRAWVTAQLQAPATLYTGFPVEPAHQRPGCNNWPGASAAELRCWRDTYTLFQVERQFIVQAMTAPDQLRQRVALALSQIFVATNHEYPAYAMASFQNRLRQDAFGNFRTLLEDVTTHPVMGRTLDVVNNSRRHPNENYAREILQLFSIGLVELTSEGRPRPGPSGAPRATYGQATIEDLARIFTGWTYAPMPGKPLAWDGEPRYDLPMVPVEAEHDAAPKHLLPGCADTPAGADTRADLKAALDCIVAHPNVGPFIGRHLIQALVTSNPGPAYVGRVSAVFANNGTGVRGDLGAVVRAILLDPEARGDAPPPAFTGHVREPLQLLIAPLRALGGTTDGLYPAAQAKLLRQPVYQAPSVFSFYPPDYPVPGQDVRAPELFLVDSAAVGSYAYYVTHLVYNDDHRGTTPDVPGSTGTHLPLEHWASASSPEELLDTLGLALLPRGLSPATRATLRRALAAEADPAARARHLAYLLLLSPDYRVVR